MSLKEMDQKPQVWDDDVHPDEPYASILADMDPKKRRRCPRLRDFHFIPGKKRSRDHFSSDDQSLPECSEHRPFRRVKVRGNCTPAGEVLQGPPAEHPIIPPEISAKLLEKLTMIADSPAEQRSDQPKASMGIQKDVAAVIEPSAPQPMTATQNLAEINKNIDEVAEQPVQRPDLRPQTNGGKDPPLQLPLVRSQTLVDAKEGVARVTDSSAPQSVDQPQTRERSVVAAGPLPLQSIIHPPGNKKTAMKPAHQRRAQALYLYRPSPLKQMTTLDSPYPRVEMIPGYGRNAQRSSESDEDERAFQEKLATQRQALGYSLHGNADSPSSASEPRLDLPSNRLLEKVHPFDTGQQKLVPGVQDSMSQVLAADLQWLPLASAEHSDDPAPGSQSVMLRKLTRNDQEQKLTHTDGCSNLPPSNQDEMAQALTVGDHVQPHLDSSSFDSVPPTDQNSIPQTFVTGHNTHFDAYPDSFEDVFSPDTPHDIVDSDDVPVGFRSNEVGFPHLPPETRDLIRTQIEEFLHNVGDLFESGDQQQGVQQELRSFQEADYESVEVTHGDFRPYSATFEPGPEAPSQNLPQFSEQPDTSPDFPGVVIDLEDSDAPTPPSQCEIAASNSDQSDEPKQSGVMSEFKRVALGRKDAHTPLSFSKRPAPHEQRALRVPEQSSSDKTDKSRVAKSLSKKHAKKNQGARSPIMRRQGLATLVTKDLNEIIVLDDGGLPTPPHTGVPAERYRSRSISRHFPKLAQDQSGQLSDSDSSSTAGADLTYARDLRTGQTSIGTSSGPSHAPSILSTAEGLPITTTDQKPPNPGVHEGRNQLEASEPLQQPSFYDVKMNNEGTKTTSGTMKPAPAAESSQSSPAIGQLAAFEGPEKTVAPTLRQIQQAMADALSEIEEPAGPMNFDIEEAKLYADINADWTFQQQLDNLVDDQTTFGEGDDMFDIPF